jgi:hypothetical protein
MSYNPFEHLDPVFGEKKIRNKKKYTWIESALDIEETEHQHLTTSHTKLYVGTIITRQKIRWFFVIVGCGLLLIMSRIFYLQIFPTLLIHQNL